MQVKQYITKNFMLLDLLGGSKQIYKFSQFCELWKRHFNSLIPLRDSQKFSLTSDALPCLGDVCPVVYHRSPTNKHISDAFQYGTTCSARIIKHSPRNQYLILVFCIAFQYYMARFAFFLGISVDFRHFAQ